MDVKSEQIPERGWDLLCGGRKEVPGEVSLGTVACPQCHCFISTTMGTAVLPWPAGRGLIPL